MRLLGRRLPDVLIGVLIVVLALGLGSLLLTQRNRAAVTSAPDQTTQTPPAATIPAAPGNIDTAQTAPSTPDTAATTPTQTPSQTAPTQTTQTPSAPPDTSTPAGTPQPDITAPPVTAAPNTTAPGTLLPDASQTTGGQTVPAAPPRSGGAVATSENRTPLRSDYRISLGTFGSVAEATAKTAAVKALGYTVYPIDLGTQVVAQVGPFADAASANAAVADIRRAYSGAVVYAPRGSAAPNTPANTNSTSAASSQTIPAAPVSRPAPSGPVYLQVGAFDRQESAQKMVGMLSDLGYSPTVQAPEGKKVTVLVGPFTGPAVVAAESKLSDNGMDHFRVR